MVSGAEPSMSREMSNSVRIECGRKERQKSQCAKQAGLSLPKDSRRIKQN